MCVCVCVPQVEKGKTHPKDMNDLVDVDSSEWQYMISYQSWLNQHALSVFINPPAHIFIVRLNLIELVLNQ